MRDSPQVEVGLCLSMTEDFLVAALPLFEDGLIDSVQWTFDRGWTPTGIPTWVAALLDEYGAAGRLSGHGVEYSVQSAEFTERQAAWLGHLREEVSRRRYRRLSEHVGFITAGSFVNGTVFPAPRCQASIDVGRESLRRLEDAAEAPFGLENLAFALSREDVEAQGEQLEAMLAPTDGFVLLDLHNLYCQSVNFDIDADRLLDRVPLGRVRELHVAGGEWSAPRFDPAARPFRRDTHVASVPDEVFALLELALDRCPRVEAVFIERAEHTLSHGVDFATFAADLGRVRRIVAASGAHE